MSEPTLLGAESAELQQIITTWRTEAAQIDPSGLETNTNQVSLAGLITLLTNASQMANDIDSHLLALQKYTESSARMGAHKMGDEIAALKQDIAALQAARHSLVDVSNCITRKIESAASTIDMKLACASAHLNHVMRA